jgi:hypothetical protein
LDLRAKSKTFCRYGYILYQKNEKELEFPVAMVEKTIYEGLFAMKKIALKEHNVLKSLRKTSVFIAFHRLFNIWRKFQNGMSSEKKQK